MTCLVMAISLLNLIFYYNLSTYEIDESTKVTKALIENYADYFHHLVKTLEHCLIITTV